MVKTIRKRCSVQAYKIQKLLSSEFPKIVPRPISWSNGIMTSEYTDGVDTCNISNVTNKVVENIQTIKKKYPNFRHNNLNVHSILLTKNGPMIFGFERAHINGGPDKDIEMFRKSVKIYFDNTSFRSNLMKFIKNSGVNVIPSGKK